MHLMYYLDESGKRVYTLKVCSIDLCGQTVLADLSHSHTPSFFVYRKKRPLER